MAINQNRISEQDMHIDLEKLMEIYKEKQIHESISGNYRWKHCRYYDESDRSFKTSITATRLEPGNQILGDCFDKS